MKDVTMLEISIQEDTLIIKEFSIHDIILYIE